MKAVSQHRNTPDHQGESYNGALGPLKIEKNVVE